MTIEREAMLFNSIHFCFFFLFFVPVYFLLPHRARLYFLLAASCYFYMVLIPRYILILLFLICVDYAAGIWIEKAEGPKRKTLLGLSLVANLSVLGVFKYYNFFVGNLSQTLEFFHLEASLPLLSWVLPVGLSFHTFQSLSYTIEVYLGKQRAEKDFLLYSLYVMFWPQLVAGPIERPENFLPQLHKTHFFDAYRVTEGLKQMLLGFVKKVLIADYLAKTVTRIYAHPQEFSSLELLVASYFFAIQIYCDFSGYSDIALGCARILGFDLMRNFNFPYVSRSISEFWKRWHISLSTWFRDYVYIPLGGNRVSLARQCLNICIVFALSGLWHGANWTFVAWGTYHGLLLSIGLLASPLLNAFFSPIRRIFGESFTSLFSAFLTFHWVTLGWILFRANTMGDAWYVLTHLGLGPNFSWNEVRLWLSMGGKQFLAGLAIATYPAWKPGLAELKQRLAISERVLHWIQWSLYYAAIFLIYFRGVADEHQFIYFQF